MDRQQIKEVLRTVFGRSFVTRDLGAWVSMHCPLAPWKHARGIDRSPSAGVSVNEDGISFWHCFSCKGKGTFGQLLRAYSEYTGDDLGELIEEIEDGEFLGPLTMESFEEKRAYEEVLMPLDDSIYMDLYDSAAGHPYLKRRGISKETARKLELLYDPADPADGEPRILFPVRGADGLLYGFSGRATQKTAYLKVRDYHGLKKSSMILGAHLAIDCKRIVLVEGLMDYAMMHELGECGCATMHSSLTDDQANVLRNLDKPIHVLYDNDEAGRSGVPEVVKRMRGYVPLLRPKYPRVKVEDTSERGWHWLKDPAELLKEELEEMLRDSAII